MMEIVDIKNLFLKNGKLEKQEIKMLFELIEEKMGYVESYLEEQKRETENLKRVIAMAIDVLDVNAVVEAEDVLIGVMMKDKEMRNFNGAN